MEKEKEPADKLSLKGPIPASAGQSSGPRNGPKEIPSAPRDRSRARPAGLSCPASPRPARYLSAVSFILSRTVFFKSDSQGPTDRTEGANIGSLFTYRGPGGGAKKRARGKRAAVTGYRALGQESRSFFEARGRRMKAEPPNAAAGLRSKIPAVPHFNTPGRRSPVRLSCTSVRGSVGP